MNLHQHVLHGIEGVGDVEAEELLALLDAENVHAVGKSEVGFSCFYIPGHAQGDRNPSAHVNRDTLLWRCKGCGRAGTLLELVKVALPEQDGKPTNHVQALRWLRENFGEATRRPASGSLVTDLLDRLNRVHGVCSAPALTLPDEAATIGPEGIFALNWRSDHPAAVYMRERGFAPEVLEDWQLGFDSWTNRVTIPIRAVDGTLVGFKGRAIDGRSPKYDLLGDTPDRAPRYGMGHGFDMHDARSVVFGLDRCRGCKRTCLVEGELNAIACHAAGVFAAAPGTTAITDRQLWLLRAHVDELVLCYDSDEGGEGAVWGRTDPATGKFYPGLVEKILPYFRLYVVDDHPDDPAAMASEDIRALYAGARHWLAYAFPSAAGV
jgi:hypothetical protein